MAGTPYAGGATGTTSSNSVDFTPYRSGQPASTTGEWPIGDAPIPVEDAAPSAPVLTGPATAAPGTTVAVSASSSDDFGVSSITYSDGQRSTTPPYTANVTIPTDAACGSTRTVTAVATDSAGQTATGTLSLPVTCATGASGTSGTTGTTPTGDGTVGPPTAPPGPAGPIQTPAVPPSVGAFTLPGTLSAAQTITFAPSSPVGLKQLEVYLGARKLCTLTGAPYACRIVPTGADVGRQAVTVVATDVLGSQAVVVRMVNVPRFKPTLQLGGARSKVRATVRLPSRVTTSQGCSSGTLTVRVQRRGRTLTNRQMALGRTCSAIVARRLSRGSTLNVRFGGNAVLTAASTTRRYK